MSVLFESLPFDSKVAFIISLALLLISFVLHLQKRKHSITFLFLGGLSLGLGFALIDPYFHIWDEKFHALVAKNLSETPFHPRLLNSDIISYKYKIWTESYTWLHKPPMSLWQIALSIKIFGAHVLAVRVPSILIHALTSVLIYRIGISVFTKRTAYFSALVYLLLNYNLELVAGLHTSEHIDIAFTFYITASIWAFIEYQKTRKLRWLYLVGCLVGLAILTKWLVGLLVFSGWGIYLIVYYKSNSFIEWKRLFMVLIIAALISAPWFLYTYLNFPIEYNHETAFNVKHFTDVIEGHGGGNLFYWDNLSTLYGNGLLIPLLFLFSYLLLWKTVNEKKYALLFYVWIGIVYLFFSLAATKMHSFVVIVSPLLVLAVVSLIAKGLSLITSKFKLNKTILSVFNAVLFVFLIISLLRPQTIQINHSLDSPNMRNQLLDQKNFIKNIIPGEPRDIYFFEKAPYCSYIDLMFYHSSTAINRVPSKEEVLGLSDKGYTIYVLYINERPNLDVESSSLKYIKLFSE
jgi:4-amino-4-deoxy-L-arabinose transferase